MGKLIHTLVVLLTLLILGVLIYNAVNKELILVERQALREYAERSNLPHRLWSDFECKPVDGTWYCRQKFKRNKKVIITNWKEVKQ